MGFISQKKLLNKVFILVFAIRAKENWFIEKKEAGVISIQLRPECLNNRFLSD